MEFNFFAGQVMLVMDFAENRKASYATEVKSAHFGKGQWTLHPIVAFFNDPSLECLRQHVIMVLSDDIAHDYHAVQKFTEVALQNLAAHISPIKELIMWSDGCAAQYKVSLIKGPSKSNLLVSNAVDIIHCFKFNLTSHVLYSFTREKEVLQISPSHQPSVLWFKDAILEVSMARERLMVLQGFWAKQWVGQLQRVMSFAMQKTCLTGPNQIWRKQLDPAPGKLFKVFLCWG